MSVPWQRRATCDSAALHFVCESKADLLWQHNVGPLRRDAAEGFNPGRNRHGGIVYAGHPDDGLIRSSTQLFRSREIWGLDWWTLRNRRKGDDAPYIPSGAYEEVFASGLNRYLEFANKYLGLSFPLTVEAGGVGMKGYYMGMGQLEYLGPIHDDEIFVRRKLTEFSAEEVNAFLLAIFEQFFDACAAKRPDHFNGFPPRKR